MTDRELAFKRIKRYKEYIESNDFNTFYKKINAITMVYEENGIITQLFIDAGVIDDIVQNLTTIPPGMFWGTNIREINLHNNMNRIGACAFYDCANLINLIIPEGVRVIGDNAFTFSSLETLTIPKSITKFGTGTYTSNQSPFWGCKYLKNVTLPARFKDNISLYFENYNKINFTFI